ncbi:MAG: channel protein TolC [Rhodocyclales bacterium GT-UBC]|nr:MAG: channel protein TolC [Rhodocyclales bacterium GT-UBC]
MNIRRFPLARRLGLGALLLLAVSASQATGLAELYDAARQSDPQYAAAKADLDGAMTLVPQAVGQMLPQIGLSGSRIFNDTVNETRSSVGPRSTKYDFIANQASLNLSMALFRPQLWFGLSQSKAQVRQAESLFRQAQQDLITRTAQAYFNVLLAEDNLKMAGEQKAAIAEQLKQAKRYFEAGVGTITDINEAQARYDTVVAQELSAENDLEVQVRTLEQLVGRVERKLDRLGPRFALDLPEPADVDRWLEFSLTNNPQLLSREAAYEAAQSEVNKNLSNHLPTVDLVAGRGRSENPGFTMIDNINWSNTVGIQVSVPIFSGGTTNARANQASAMKERARYDAEAARRTVTLSARQQYLNVVNGVAQVKALRQAVKSNELALYSAQRGQEAGVRTSFDVLNAQQLLYTTKRDLARETYRYVLSRLQLRSAAGLLGEEDVALIQQWLEK